jgi:hypothetical protein
MNSESAFWNSEVFGGCIFAFVIGVNVASIALTARRLASWARQEKVRVLKKQRDVTSGAPKWFHRRAVGCYYLTVEDEERHIFRGWIRVGGLFAAACNRKPEIVWDGSPDHVKR